MELVRDLIDTESIAWRLELVRDLIALYPCNSLEYEAINDELTRDFSKEMATICLCA